MKKQIDAVEVFHKLFKHPVNNLPVANIPLERKILRFNLMKEENEEYLKAVQEDNLVEVADALGDMMYILCGTIIEHGLQNHIEAVFDEIQRSNLSKLGEDGQPIYREDGKVMKGPNYSKPNFRRIFEEEFRSETYFEVPIRLIEKVELFIRESAFELRTVESTSADEIKILMPDWFLQTLITYYRSLLTINFKSEETPSFFGYKIETHYKDEVVVFHKQYYRNREDLKPRILPIEDI